MNINPFSNDRIRQMQNEMGSQFPSKTNEEVKSIKENNFLDELNAVSKSKEVEEKKDYSKYTYEELQKIPYEEMKEHKEEIYKAYENIPRKYQIRVGHVGESAREGDKGLLLGFAYCVTGNDILDKKMYEMFIEADVLNNPEKEVDLMMVAWDMGKNITRMQNGLEPTVWGMDPLRKGPPLEHKDNVLINYKYLIDVLIREHKESSENYALSKEAREVHKRVYNIYEELSSVFE